MRIPPQAPPLFNGTPESIVTDAKRLIEAPRKVQDQVAQTVRPDSATFANVLLPLAQADNARQTKSSILCFYQNVSSDPKLRDASREAQKLLDSFNSESGMREDLFQLVDAVVKKNEDLDTESGLLLDKSHKDFTRDGLGLPAGPARDRFKEIRQRISQLKMEFRKNQNEESDCVFFLPAELDGIPEDVLSELEKGTEENERKLRFPLDHSHFSDALRYAKNSETRKCVTIAGANKYPKNVAIFRGTMVLRDEAARLLGYESHAAFRLENKMAKTPENVNSFLADLRSRMTAGGQKELEELKQVKEKDLEARGEVFDGRLFLWDESFYSGMILEGQYKVHGKKIAEWFSLETTTKAMLGIFEHLFGLVFEETVGDERNELARSGKGSDLVWHEDVQVFAVWDDEEEGGGFVGYLYLDLYAREGKYQGPANFNLQPGFIREDGTRHYPATALVCSFDKPTSKKPSLLRHYEVSMYLFHELGHGIHDLVAKTQYARFHGTMTVIDFGEAPSQMLENWCWTPKTLKSLSRHYSTLSPEYFKAWEEQAKGEPQPSEQIPDEMIGSLIGARHRSFGSLFHLRLLHMGMFDMMVHEPVSHDAIENMNITAEWNRTRKEITKLDGPEVLGEGYEWGAGQANFGHAMEEYDAGFYGYLYSQVFADDMFHSVFEKDPMDRCEGRRYRHTVLEKGGAQDEMVTLIEFLGRKPEMEAFYRRLGLA